MARIFNLFGDSKKVQEPVEQKPAISIPDTRRQAPAQTISYEADLISHLKGDHVRLVNQFTSLMPALKSGDIKGFKAKLSAFKTDFQGHIIKENVKFYVYLEQSLAGDETNLELMRDFRREMNTISRAVVNFCNRYAEDSMDATGIANFQRESNDIAQALLRRIEREERDLYTLYN
ncbi:hemerythrin domain-containing protein [Permianibacter aggregans]|uniref:Hemerythrin HHE cation binding domain-containing protein n=1 Tax=Permianibacter aggregans TaxID=1510150 RepID=A0A4R6UVR8_9GAMM|nr:hemerythrin domain-containing protein [Permianibacter aggregans]QGX41551.1 hemerythrin domain-containing protein [Permianibacter aggregans]TDQ51352.1 hemerythrin HHE cation binding domain-containing protein [Permianibacter aggregans]